MSQLSMKQLDERLRALEEKDEFPLPEEAPPPEWLGDVMQGKAAGVQVITSGTPGTDPTFRIRGTGTINDNDPLFVNKKSPKNQYA